MKHKRQLPVEKTCPACGKLMMVQVSKLRRGQGKFCSNKCAASVRTKPENDITDRVRAHKKLVQKAIRHRPCNICGKPIKSVPGDVEARYARYCYSCRSHMDEEFGADRWSGAGDECGASIGA